MPDPVAVVVGLCPHGLTICRSLSAAGIRVLALEANHLLPGLSTRAAEVRLVDDINGEDLVESLISLSPTISKTGTPVLFLTNDTMISTISNSYDRICDLYKISWGESRKMVTALLRKEGIFERCLKTGQFHPNTIVVRASEELKTQQLPLAFPIIFKPDKPVSAYKTLVVDSEAELEKSIPIIESSMPAIAQEFIPGPETKIRFAALYLVDGKVIGRFEGRKLRSRPMGHTSVAVAESSDLIHALALEFFDGLTLSGPVSLEVKEGPDSRLWIIEPTVGRTDFWVGLCIQDGIDFPFIEYRQQCSQENMQVCQYDRNLWINEYRDPAGLAWLLKNHFEYARRMRIAGVYFDLTDLLPFFRWLWLITWQLPVRLLKKLANLLGA